MTISTGAVLRRTFLVGAASAAMAGVAHAQLSPIAFAGAVQGNTFKVRKNIAITAYHVNFITWHEANAIATIGARTRLNWVLTGVPRATMKALVNEAHADLKAKLTAAGVPLLADDQAKALSAGVEMLPNNTDIKGTSSPITLGEQVKKGWATFGADAAPAIKGYHNPGNPTGFAGIGMLQVNGKVGAAAKAADALVIMPNVTLDFADMSTSTGRSLAGGARANASGKVGFSLRASSVTNMIVAMDRGAPFPQALRMSKDATAATPFATVMTGEAAVKEFSGVTSDDYGNANARGDAIKVDLPVWEGLARKALQDYNTALVAAIVKGRG